MRRTIRVFVLFLPLLFASCQPIGITSDQPEEILNNNIVTESRDAAPETDSDALFDQHNPEMSGLTFDPENQMPGFDLPEEPLTEEEIAFFKDLLATIITEVDQEEATESLREIISLNDRNNQQKKKSTIEKEGISREEKRRQRLTELTAQYLKELQGRHVGGSPTKKNISTATFPPGLAAIGAEPIPAGGAVVTDKTQEALDRIEAARLAQQQLATQPIQVPDKQLMDQQIGGRPVTYKYDTNDNIIEKNANGVITRYHVDANRRYAVILAEYDGEGNLLANYTYEEGDHKPTCQYRNGHRYCYRYDDRNVRAITNENGEVTDRYRYDAFGNVTEHIKTENSAINRFLANGEYYDEDAGLYRLRARHYDPQTGRFISKDSWEGRGTDPVTLNNYLYADGNPVMKSDPSGKFSLLEMQVSNTIRIILSAQEVVLGMAILDAHDYATDPKYDTEDPTNEILFIAALNLVLPRAISKVAKFVRVRFLKIFDQVYFDVNSPVAGHVFKDTVGHVNPASNVNKERFAKLFKRVATMTVDRTDEAVAIGRLKPEAVTAGEKIFTQEFHNGQVWVVIDKNNNIKDAGINTLVGDKIEKGYIW